jgi:hypothetical protein
MHTPPSPSESLYWRVVLVPIVPVHCSPATAADDPAVSTPALEELAATAAPKPAPTSAMTAATTIRRLADTILQ